MIELLIEGTIATLSDDISADITYSLADIRTPDRRQVNYTKTLTLIGDSNNNYIFGNIFDIDVENAPNNPALPNIGVNFTPKKLANTTLYLDGVQVFDGTLRLWKVIIKGGFIFYEISLFGKLFDLFGTLGDSKLTDLDFSDLDHPYNWTQIMATWTSNIGYRYPLIDYGVNILNSGGDAEIAFGSLVASLGYRSILDRIFPAASAAYSIGFSDTSILDEMIVTPPFGFVKGSPKLFNGVLLDENAPTYGSDTDDLGEFLPFTVYAEMIVIDTISENDIFTITTTTGRPSRYTLNQNISTTVQFHLDMFGYPSVFNYSLTDHIVIEVILHTAIDSADNVVGLYDMYLDPPASPTHRLTNIEIPSKDLKTGDHFTITVRVPQDCAIKFNSGCSITAVSPSDLTDYPLLPNDTYEMKRSIPVDIKQVDFIRDFIKLFNLFVTQDPENPARYIFTPQIDFYQKLPSAAIDWTLKIDHNEEIEFTPISQLTAKEYTLTWKQDKDFWSTEYYDINKEVYGQVTYISDTDVLQNKEKIESIFSPAVMTRFDGSEIIAPAIYKVENESGIQVKKTDKFNSRLLIWGGMLPAGHDVKLMNSDDTIADTITTYPYAGHLDNPTDPTYDLNFGNTNTNLPTASVNTFSKYWGKILRDSNHKDSKLVSCTMYLKPADIASLDFSALYRIDHQFYRLNLISGFNPFALGTSKVELIKVLSL